jgi:hypothetical protein
MQLVICELKMRIDELMKPDLLSEVVLTVAGAGMIVFLVLTVWIAVLGH